MKPTDAKNMPFSEYLKLLKQNERFPLQCYSGRSFARFEDNFFELLRARGFENWEHLDQAFGHIAGVQNTERFWSVSNESGEAIVIFDGEMLDHYMTYCCEATDDKVKQLICLLNKEPHEKGGVLQDVDFKQIS